MGIPQIVQSVDDLPRKIALFGAGSTGREFLLNLRRRRPEVEIIQFFDSYATGSYEGVAIQPAGEASTASAPLVITSAFWPEIVDKLGGDVSILSNALINQASHLDAFGQFYFSQSEAPEMERRLAKLRPHFKTDDDFAILKSVFDLRVHRCEHEFFSFAKDHMHRQKSTFASIDKYSGNIDVSRIRYAVEGGVFDGQDTMQLLERLSPSLAFKKILAFDPFLGALRDGDFLSKIDASKCEFHEMALWDENGELSFGVDEGSPSNSRVGDNPDLLSKKTAAIKLDTFASERGIPIDLIKLDVEGAEMNVLRGAANTIASHKPQCAISTYHRREHLLDVPEFLLSLNPDYVFSMYAYNACFIDVVLHAD